MTEKRLIWHLDITAVENKLLCREVVRLGIALQGRVANGIGKVEMKEAMSLFMKLIRI